ncbi:MAG: hypothetical protein A3J58_01225 [Candidatus Sungbacteria bacterium RIFCSPHIGHO2_02_FULL_52_23]|uniref:Uncharacterized protein n=1 Tax=Candidatus Sungbacteria bacterium RIFCSPHIGHO2_02_FULL_52_23 TaxID=1802274 RepID=A0A1G2KXY8_9BACT|nr:MAG: hypothetical protein A3J58_01225 [Candidatus Sungbacteria bacterium RIFCSPHIGHO2_02_FULL_52_23]
MRQKIRAYIFTGAQSRVLIAVAICFCAGFLFSLVWAPEIMKTSKSAEKDAIEQLRQAQKDCAGEQERNKQILCYKKQLKTPLEHAGPAPYIRAVESLFGTHADEKNSVTMCHDLLHVVGGLAGASSGDFASVVSSCTEACTYGCYHGTIEGATSAGRTSDDLITACAGLARGASKSACFHGLGHGAASLTSFRLYDALAICDNVPQDWRADCGSGVMMEIYEPSTFVHERKEFPDDIPAFCATLRNPYSDTCYTTAGLHAYARSKGVSEAFATCRRVPQEFRNRCIFYIGHNAYFVFNGTVKEIELLCAAGRESASDESPLCLQGAITASVVADSSAVSGFGICASAEMENRQSCADFLVTRLDEHLGRDVRARLCEITVSPDWLKEICRMHP